MQHMGATDVLVERPPLVLRSTNCELLPPPLPPRLPTFHEIALPDFPETQQAKAARKEVRDLIRTARQLAALF